MEEDTSPSVLEGEITGIRFCLASHKEISTASVSGCSINHPSQLSNPFLGLPLEFGKCESCGTSEPGQCEGHFGYIELPIPIYHPSHLSELKRLLSFLCLKCLKMKNKLQLRNSGVAERLLSSCCEDSPQVVVKEFKTTDGASCLALKFPSKSKPRDSSWNFLDRYGFHYGDDTSRPLLPCEVMEILRRIPQETRRKLSAKGYIPQDGYILRYLPVPPNCLSVPDVSDGVSIMSSDLSTSILKKVLRKIEIIRSSRSGTPNFESHEVEANDLQCAVNQYLEIRGTTRAPRNIDARFGISKDASGSSTKVWLEKMRTLFISKGSGFSSRSVITGEPYRRVNEIGIPAEVAQRITFEEKVSEYNMEYLQKLVDDKLCLTYRDGSSTYSLREGSKGHTLLRPGQVVHRRIMDGDMVFIDRPPTTHKHSLQALSVYLHSDHTVKINPIICGPLGADFDGDCIHLFYPQSLAARAEVLELFSVEKQLLSSHNGSLNLQMATDSLLSLRNMLKRFFFGKEFAQQLSMFLSTRLPSPAIVKGSSGALWTAVQILQSALPSLLEYSGEKFIISRSELLMIDFGRDKLASVMNELITSILMEKGPKDALSFFDSLQPLLMENLFTEGSSVCLGDFYISRDFVQDIQKVSPLLGQLRSSYNELIDVQIENHIKTAKTTLSSCILKSSALGDLIDPKSDSATTKLVQQIGFLGQQLSGRRKFYSNTLVEDVSTLFRRKYPSNVVDYPTAEFGLIRGCFFRGLDPYEEIVHSLSTREVIVRSSRGLSEPGTLFKNLMAILRDVAICYDGTVRNVAGNSVIQFEYGLKSGDTSQLFPAGEPVGVLAATAMSNPAYKAVLDSTPSSSSSWEMMKEILLCKVNFRNELIDRKVILYLNNCDCGRKHCQEKAAYSVLNHLKEIRLKDVEQDFRIEYMQQQTESEGFDTGFGLVGYIHFRKERLRELNIGLEEVLQKCQDTISSFCKKKKLANLFKKVALSVSDCSSFQHTCSEKGFDRACITFFWQDATVDRLEEYSHILADIIYPVLLETVIKGDPRISSANIIWVSPDTIPWAKNSGELAIHVMLEKSVIRRSGDAWRIVLDSSLPVIHLIDTKRSIPYAIKQVQELLGISCAFEQAVQRLSASVEMVAKGVLREHLILLANSMTCTGNMVGFNTGGYKALSQSLKVQVPFTEATLITPKKCFERAAEKCHTDSLSSIVASCAWGKRVAVGTGSNFDLLWAPKEFEVKEDSAMDVYNFLHMVTPANVMESTACLGAEIDDLVPEYESAEWSLSPERASGSEKLTFEDGVNFQNDVDNHSGELNWEKVGTSGNNGFGGDAWGGKSGTSGSQGDAWGNWGAVKKDTVAVPEDSTVKHQEASNSSGWNAADAWGKKESNFSAWGTSNLGEDKSQEKPSGSASWDVVASQAKKVDDGSATDAENKDTWSTWASGASEAQATVHKRVNGGNENLWSANGGAGKQKDDDTNSCTSTKSQDDWKSNAWGDVDSWSKQTKDVDTWGSNVSGHKKTMEAKSDAWGNVDTWGSEKTKDVDTNSNAWGRKMGDANSNAWGKNTGDANFNAWSKKTGDANSEGGKSTRDANSEAWGKKTGDANSVAWGKKTGDANSDGWGKKTGDANSDGWGKKTGEADHGKAHVWDAAQSKSGWNSGGLNKDENAGTPKSDDMAATNTWDRQKSVDNSPVWGSQNESTPAVNPSGWNTPIENSSQGEKVQWGQRNGGKGGWGSDVKRNRPPRGNDDARAAMYTVTRQRLDLFTSEEQEILSDVEPLMRSIRRIMHQTGYNDEDPLSAEDQLFIVDKVFCYHPTKDEKMGAGIDHLTVSKHTTFQESRCLFVVSTDGSRQDFSYRKCIDNFIRGKYPNLADAFLGKYFSKPQPKVTRENTSEANQQNPSQENAGTQEQNALQENTGSQEQNALQENAGSQEQNAFPENAGSQEQNAWQENAGSQQQ